MIKKRRYSTPNRFINRFKAARGPSARARRRKRTVILCAGAGFAAAILLLVVLLSAPPADFSEVDTVNRHSLGTPDSAIASERTPNGSGVPTVTGMTAGGSSPQPGGSAPLPATPTATPQPTLSPKPSPTPVPVDWNELVEFYQVKADLYYNKVGYSTNSYNYTDDDVYLLAQLIYGEARGESTKGKIAVGNVVMNRVLARGYPGSTIKAVVTAGGQFSGYSSSIKPSSACKYAARMVLEREVWVIPQNVYFFNSDRDGNGNWGSHKFYTRIEGHAFYTENYRGRSRIGDIPPQLFERTFQWPQYGCKPAKRVYRIQMMLRELHYDVKADSYFGKTTKDALMAFQSKNKIRADGVAGPSTIKALIKAYGKEKYIAKFL